MQSSSAIHSQLIVSRKQLWWNLKISFSRKCMCHLDHHRKFLTKKIGCVIWILMSLEAAKTSNESNQKPNTKLSSTGRPVCYEKKEIEEPSKFDRDTISQEKRDEVTDSTSTGRPVCGHESTKRCVLTPKHVENDQTGTGDPFWWIRRRSTTLISEYQDCHRQLWKKQNISEFKSL